MHPWRGQFLCQAGLVTYRESKDLGGYCSFEIEFIVDTGGLPSPLTQIDTVSQLLHGLASLAQLGIEAYETASLIIQHPGMLLTYMGGLLGSVVSGLTGLPAGLITGLSTAIGDILLAPGTDSATASAVPPNSELAIA